MSKLIDINIDHVKKIDPEAAAILGSAVKTVKAILKRRAALDRQGQSDETLFVMAGEHHNLPAHKLHHMLVLQGLYEANESIVSALEHPTNMVTDEFLKSFLSGISQIEPKDIGSSMDLYKANPSILGLCEIYASIVSGNKDSYYASNILHTHMFRLHASSNGQFIGIHSDTARLSQKFLDVSDPQTAQSMRKALKKVEHNMSLKSQEGLYVRNIHMAQKLSDVASQYKTRIAMQLCGQTHVNGGGLDSHQAEGLCAIFKRSAKPVIGVFLNPVFDYSEGLDEDELIISHAPPEHSARYNVETNESTRPRIERFFSFLDFHKHFDTQEAEAEFVNTKLDNMGLSDLKIK
mgnify:CR=1 FL=1|tara:strand:+ start:186488 stop:187534 length:1047 start_codon:yes stop_codon:yes gene_type:complete